MFQRSVLSFVLLYRSTPWRRKWQPTLVYLPGKSHDRSLVGYSPWGRKESDTTLRLNHRHYSSIHSQDDCILS